MIYELLRLFSMEYLMRVTSGPGHSVQFQRYNDKMSYYLVLSLLFCKRGAFPYTVMLVYLYTM
jgi:hypothetical protein